jgi:shikimate dehydrogenase
MKRAEALADTLTYTGVGDWKDLGALFEGADLIVQATTLGMGVSHSPNWPVHRCKPDAIVVDIVYRPLETPLLAAARARGLKTVDGLGMLIHQGARSFEIWFGIKPDVAKARARLEAALA